MKFLEFINTLLRAYKAHATDLDVPFEIYDTKGHQYKVAAFYGDEDGTFCMDVERIED